MSDEMIHLSPELSAFIDSFDDWYKDLDMKKRSQGYGAAGKPPGRMFSKEDASGQTAMRRDRWLADYRIWHGNLDVDAKSRSGIEPPEPLAQ